MTDNPDDPNDTNTPEASPTPSLDSGESSREFETGFELPQDEEELSEVESSSRGPAVAAGRGRMIVFGALFVSAMIYMVSMFLGSSKPATTSLPGSDPNNPSDRDTSIAAAPPPPSSNLSIPPAPPPLQAPSAPLPPPPPQAEQLPTLTTPAGTIDGVAPPPPPPPPPPEIKATKPFGDDKKTQERLRSGMLVSGVTTNGVVNKPNTGDSLSPETSAARDSLGQKDANLAYLNNAYKASGAEKAKASIVNNLESTIVQGKIIEAVLETAINTDLPGTIRAMISRNVYAESGRKVMIPKGSRLIGTYSTSIMRGQRRVLIAWTRVIRPDGVDIQIGSQAVDALGRAGMEGAVDNKYMEVFSTAILTSMVSLGVAVLGDAVTSGDSTSTTNTDGSNTSTGSAGAAAVGQAAANVGNIANQIIKDSLDARPTITIDQGTRINVFVNRDLTFVMDDKDKNALDLVQ